MNYKMTVRITDPNTKEGMMSEMLFKLNCDFVEFPDTYGNKTYLSIRSEDRRFDNYYDLRYDDRYHRGKEEQFLEWWARNYWTGEDGAWAIKSLEIEKV